MKTEKTRHEKRREWLKQIGQVRCACGDTASYGLHGRDTISGTVGGRPAIWLGCPNCTGHALGFPLVD
jgi:hypothetical protein